jgi:competence protein ComEC
VCALLLVFTQWQHFQNSISKNQFIVYSVNGHSALEWISRGRSYFVTDSVLWNDKERIRFHIRPNRLNSGVVEINKLIPFKKEINNGLSLYTWHDKLIVALQEKNITLPSVKQVDYLVISNNSCKPELISSLNANMIILDGSNTRNYINRCKKAFDNKRVYSVLDEGAFVLTN